MWAHALDLLEQADRLQRQFFGLSGARAACPTWEPPIDVYENETELHFEIALPGVPADGVEISIEGSAIRVRAQRSLPGAAQRGSILRLEIPYGVFERRLELPPGHYELGRHELVNGCVHLVLRKR